MTRETLEAVALTAEVILALRKARRSIRVGNDEVARMMSARVCAVTSEDERLARLIGRTVSRWARVVHGSNCLVRAVAAHNVLAVRGVDARLCVGHAATATAGFSAHAWLEIGGVAVVGEPSPVRFSVPQQ